MKKELASLACSWPPACAKVGKGRSNLPGAAAAAREATLPNTRAPTALAAAFVILFGWTVAKGLLPITHTDELYYWLTTYQNGFVRRGLFGTLIAPLIGTGSPGQLHLVAAESCIAALIAIVVLTTTMVVRLAVRSPGPLPWAIAGLVAASPFVALVAHHVGYPDAIIAVAVLACGWTLPSAPAWAVGIMLILCSMLHELAFLLLLPIVIHDRLVDPRGKFTDGLLISAAACVGLCVPLVSGHGPQKLVSDLMAAGLTLNDAKAQVGTSLHQSIGQASTKMLLTWRHYPVNGCLGILYAGMPGVMLMVLGWPAMVSIAMAAPRRSRRLLALSAYVAACLGPMTVLAIAWDLARIVSFTTITSLLSVTRVCRRVTTPAHPAAIVASASVALIFVMLPAFNMYFDYARPLRLAMMSTVCPPCAHLAVGMANFYNRDLPHQERVGLVSNPLYGDGP